MRNATKANGGPLIELIRRDTCLSGRRKPKCFFQALGGHCRAEAVIVADGADLIERAGWRKVT
jgi:hypothetical protein